MDANNDENGKFPEVIEWFPDGLNNLASVEDSCGGHEVNISPGKWHVNKKLAEFSNSFKPVTTVY